MPQQRNATNTEREGKVILALQAFNAGQFRSLRRAAQSFNVPHQRLSDRANKTKFRQETTPNYKKLTRTEEQTIVQYILDLDSQGFAPYLCEVADIADKILAVCGGEPVGKNWAKRLVTRLDKLNIAFN